MRTGSRSVTGDLRLPACRSLALLVSSAVAGAVCGVALLCWRLPAATGCHSSRLLGWVCYCFAASLARSLPSSPANAIPITRRVGLRCSYSPDLSPSLPSLVRVRFWRSGIAAMPSHPSRGCAFTTLLLRSCVVPYEESASARMRCRLPVRARSSLPLPRLLPATATSASLANSPLKVGGLCHSWCAPLLPL